MLQRSAVRLRLRCVSPLVTMIHSADSRQGDDLAGLRGPALHGPSMGRVLAQREMATIVVVVGNLIAKQLHGVTFVQNDEMVKYLSPTTADTALDPASFPFGTGCPSIGGSSADASGRLYQA